MKSTYQGYAIEVTDIDRSGRLVYQITDPDGNDVEVDVYSSPKRTIDHLIAAKEREAAERARVSEMRKGGKSKPKKPILTRFVHEGTVYTLKASYSPGNYWSRTVEFEVGEIRGIKAGRYGSKKVYVRSKNGEDTYPVDASKLSLVGFESDAIRVEQIDAEIDSLTALHDEIRTYREGDNSVELLEGAVVVTNNDLRAEIPFSIENGEFVGYDPNDLMGLLASQNGLYKNGDSYYSRWFRSKEDAERYNALGEEINELREEKRAIANSEADVIAAILSDYQQQLAEWSREVREWEAVKFGWKAS